MEFTPYLDTRDLAKLAAEAVEVGQAVLDGDETITQDEIRNANHTFRAMSNALKSLGYQELMAEDLEAKWLEIGNTMHVTLVREDTIGEYWSDSAVEFGRLTSDQFDEFGPVIDWDAYARNQDAVQVNFALPDSYGLNVKPITYYIF